MKKQERIVTDAYTEFDGRLAAAFPKDAPGAAALVVKSGEVLLQSGYGMANLEWKIPAQPDTVFRIGSVTKQFTAVMTLMLAEQGKLALDDPLEKFLPGYPTHGHTITVEHLLTHTSGIKSMTGMQSWPTDWGKDFTLEALIDYFKFQPMDFAPGQKWLYNNSGYILLAAVIEKASGTAYADFLQQAILTPLGMKSTCLELPGVLIPRRAAGYSKGPQGIVNATTISMTQPLSAGGMVSTVGDLSTWEVALIDGQLISAESLKRARTAVILPDGSPTYYGYGWGVHTYAGYEVIAHGGGIHGFICFALSVPSERLYCAVLTNSDTPAENPEELAFEAALTALGLTYPMPVAVTLTPKELAKFAGKFQAKDGTAFEITLEDGSLMLAWPGLDEKRKMSPTAKNELVDMKNPYIRNIFSGLKKGRYTAIESRNQYDEPGLHASRVEAKKET